MLAPNTHPAQNLTATAPAATGQAHAAQRQAATAEKESINEKQCQTWRFTLVQTTRRSRCDALLHCCMLRPRDNKPQVLSLCDINDPPYGVTRSTLHSHRMTITHTHSHTLSTQYVCWRRTMRLLAVAGQRQYICCEPGPEPQGHIICLADDIQLESVLRLKTDPNLTQDPKIPNSRIGKTFTIYWYKLCIYYFHNLGDRNKNDKFFSILGRFSSLIKHLFDPPDSVFKDA